MDFSESDKGILGHFYLKRRGTISYHGYTKELLFSAFQKYIRRGELEKATWCVLEVDRFKQLLDPAVLTAYLTRYPDRNEKDTCIQVKGIRTNMVNRLIVITVEDIGIGHPEMPVLIDALLTEWEASKRENTQALINIVELLCRARKARYLSDLKTVYHLPPYYGTSLSEEARILEKIQELRVFYGIKPETGLETMATTDMSIFYWISRNIKEITVKHPIWDVLQVSPVMTCLKKWFTKKIHENVLFFYQAILLTILDIPDGGPLPGTEEFPSLDWYNRVILAQIDDYCNDRHVRGSGETSVTRFALEGAQCANEATELIDGRYRAMYIRLKQQIDSMRTHKEEPDEDGPPRKKLKLKLKLKVHLMETKYIFVARTQVTTSAAKADAYFAVQPDTNVLLFVKGPLKKMDAENALQMNNWKKHHALPYLESLRIEVLLPNRWLTGIPLGARNKIDRDVPAVFLVAESVIPLAQVQAHLTTYGEYKRLKGGEKWPSDTVLVDWRHISSHIDLTNVTVHEMTDYVLALLARWIFGISDLADRNFLRKDGRILSIDEEYVDRPVNFLTELQTKKCYLVKTWLMAHYDERIAPVLTRWSVPEQNRAKYAIVRDYKNCLTLFEKIEK